MKKRKMLKAGITMLSCFALAGCSIVGGNKDSVNNSNPVVEDVTTKYSVTFESSGGTLVKSQTVTEGLKATKPEDPTKEGYEFKGWYVDSNYTNAYSFDSVVNSNITLYAKWEAKNIEPAKETYVVTFNTDGGSSVPSQNIVEGNTIEKPSNPTKEGYIFLGWYENLTDKDSFDFTTVITANITLHAKWITVSQNQSLVYYDGYDEGIYARWADTDAMNASVKVKKSDSDSWDSVDDELIRQTDSTTARVDTVGLSAGSYDLMITTSNNELYVIEDIEVSAADRSGYAHFGNNDGVGAYKNDGTAKDDAVIVYVSEENKNTVTAKIGNSTCKGISAILQTQSKSNKPLIVRIIGTINAATWNKIDYKKTSTTQITPSDVIGANGKALELKPYDEEAIIRDGYNTLNTTNYTKLNGLTNKIKYDASKSEFDSYYNMLDISSAKNVTVEGIGSDAGLFQWGFTWKGCSSIEIKNLTFDDNTEDACSFEASDTKSTTIAGFKTGHIWVHNNTFNEGKNYWDVCNEQDKHEGDGATDFKGMAYVTISYNHYYKNHKTGLIGGGDSHGTACVTFHHNYYESNNSRLPLGRGANMHMYNNYYYGSTGTNMSLRAGAYAFIEGCYFENCNNPMELKEGTGVNGEKLNAVIKLYNSIVKNCNGTNNATTVTSRTDKVENQNVYASDFDTNSSVFYYDSVNEKSNVTLLETAEQAKVTVLAKAGTLKDNDNIYEPGEKFTLSFETGDENVTVESESVTAGRAVTLPTASKDGYYLEGWYKEANCETKVDSPFTVNEDTTLYAKWNEAIAIKFMDGNDTLSTKYIEPNTLATSYEATKEGYVLVGWTLTENSDELFDFSNEFSSNTVLYAVWKKNNEKLAADNYDLGASFGGGKTLYSGTAFDVVTSSSLTIAKNFSAATSEDGALVFSYAFLPGGSTSTNGYQIVAKTSCTVIIYYTMTDSKFTTANQSKSGELKVDNVQVTTTTSNKANTIAYAYELEMTENTTYTLTSSSNRLAIFGIVIK